MQRGIEVPLFFSQGCLFEGARQSSGLSNPLKTPGVTEGVSGPWICCVQGWVTGRGPEPASGRGQLLWGRPESWESLSHRNPVFVYGAQCSYLPPVLTPHSSCFKSLLLIFSSLLPQPHPVLLFLVFLFFSMEIRCCGDTRDSSIAAFSVYMCLETYIYVWLRLILYPVSEVVHYVYLF